MVTVSQMVNPIANPSTSGDVFLAPLKWCGRQWNALYEYQADSCVGKVLQVAYQIILGGLLSIPTAIAFVPALIGVLMNSNDTVIWNVKMDQPLRDRCIALGVNSENNNAVLADNILKVVPNGLSSIVVNNAYAIDRVISIQTSRLRMPLLGNLMYCFRQNPALDPKVVSALPDVIFGVNRGDSTLLDSKFDGIYKVDFQVFKDLQTMRLSIN